MTNLLNLIESAFGYGKGKPKDGHWPSEITQCQRMLVYRWLGTGESNPIDSTGWWRIKLGQALHVICQDTLEEIERDPDQLKDLGWPGFHVETEVRSGKLPIEGLKFPISYRMDNRFVDNDGMRAIAEYKSAFGRGMQDVKENGPKDNALGQVIMYLILSDRIAEKITRAYVMYVARDNADRCLFILDYVEKGFILYRMFESGEVKEVRRISISTWDRIIEKLAYVEQCAETKTLPDRPYKVAIKNGEIREKFTKDKVDYKSDWQCMYCSFLTKCQGERAANYPDVDNSAEFKKGDAELEEF